MRAPLEPSVGGASVRTAHRDRWISFNTLKFQFWITRCARGTAPTWHRRCPVKCAFGREGRARVRIRPFFYIFFTFFKIFFLFKGFSGNPLTIYANNSEPVLIGIASFNDRGNCNEETQHPVRFMRIAYFANWIRKQIGVRTWKFYFFFESQVDLNRNFK
jgi:hypothetical protein